MTNPIETARAALLKIWPDGSNCSHAHAREDEITATLESGV